ncbi:MAG: hypothetical protein GXP62_21000 [Oligoflexia bacterium]|nr:hypothetical protein [Oligoflexia bacterium]
MITIGCLLLLSLTGPVHADDALPSTTVPPKRPQQPDPYQPTTVPSYGADVSVGYALSALLGSWPDAGASGLVLARYDVFLVSADQPGPRLGLSLWGATTAWPRQRYTEPQTDTATGRSGTFTTSSYGVMTVIRGAPEAPVSFAGGLGFGRTDLLDYYQGPLAIPMLNFEGGARLRTTSRTFVDILTRAQWGTTRSPTASSYHEWWGIQLLISPGLHLH